jgi:predicted small lipoprotein YifL
MSAQFNKVLLLLLVSLVACGRSGENEAEEAPKVADPLLEQLSGSWSVVDGAQIQSVFIDPVERRLDVMDEAGAYHQYAVNASPAEDGGTLLLLSTGDGVSMWRVALAGDHGRIRKGVDGAEPGPGYPQGVPELFRDPMVAHSLAEKRRRQQATIRMLQMF